MIYRNDYRTVIKALNVSEFSFLASSTKNTGFTFDSVINPDEKSNFIEILGNLTGKSIAMESLTADSKEGCEKIGLEDVDVKCNGKMKFRSV